MAIYKVQSILNYSSNLPKDVATNTWYFDINDSGSHSIIETIEDFISFLVTNFWNAQHSPGTIQLASRMSPYIKATGLDVKAYLHSDPKPQVPRVHLVGLPFNRPSSGGSLPFEVAAVMSFHGPTLSGQPQARRRGRSFIGPLAVGANDPGSTTVGPRLEAGLINALIGGSRFLSGGSDDGWTWQQQVYSKAGGGFTPVTGGWVDNEHDTQRRRELSASSRTVWNAPV